jgi:branched-chain amino acid transport system ATP-binding protein
MSKIALGIKNLKVNYGEIEALHGLNFSVEEGQSVAIIGPNGAGKTTTLRSIVGLTNVTNGSINFYDEDIVGKRTHQIIQKGITMAPEGRQIFKRLTVMENLKMGAYFRKDKEEISNDLETVMKLFPILKIRIKQVAGTMSGGEQQMLCIGRALMSKPKLLLLDEPSLGLAPLIVEEIFKVIKILQGRNITILLVEQNAKAALNIVDKGYVIENGSVVLSGTGKELLNDKRVKESYLAENI